MTDDGARAGLDGHAQLGGALGDADAGRAEGGVAVDDAGDGGGDGGRELRRRLAHGAQLAVAEVAAAELGLLLVDRAERPPRGGARRPR